MIKKTGLILCGTLLLFLFPSCSSPKGYRDNVRLSELSDAIFEELNSPWIYQIDTVGTTDDYFSRPDYVTDSAVFYTGSTENIDEFGIYHVTEGHAEAMATLLKERYLNASYDQNREWYNSYIPKETPKLRDAEVKIFGNYVIYTILNTADRNTVYHAAKKHLSAEQ